LAATLAERGWAVTVLARHDSEEGPGRFVVPVDAGEPNALAGALDAAIDARGAFDLAVVYAPFAPAESVREISSRASGRLLYALTSEWEAPDADRAERDAWAPDAAGGRAQRVTLGWARAPDGTRWHTPEEVSSGVIRALESGEEEVTLGTLSP
jgi:hypothetical protein